MLARKPRMLVTVALANKTARIVWAVLTKNEDYCSATIKVRERDNQDENLPGWIGVGRSPEPVHPGRSIPQGPMMSVVGQVR